MSDHKKFQPVSPIQTQKELLSVTGPTPDELKLSCQDDNWLLAFIQDTEEYHMLDAPSRLQAETLQKSETKPCSKRLQLIIYSIRVSLAAAGAIIILFTMPFFLEQSWSKSTPPYLEKSAFGPLFSQSLIPFPGKEQSWQERIGFRNISESISDLSNELLGGNLYDKKEK